MWFKPRHVIETPQKPTKGLVGLLGEDIHSGIRNYKGYKWRRERKQILLKSRNDDK